MHTFALALRHKADIKNGALVQLVRIHACHAWGHGFESRTHRRKPFSYTERLFCLCISVKVLRSHKALRINRITMHFNALLSI